MDSVGLYEKFEVSLQMNAKFENPYDPDQIDIMATFISPAGKEWKVPGFYNQVFWSSFAVRFSPNELGEWKYSVRVKDKTGEVTSEEKAFKARPTFQSTFFEGRPSLVGGTQE